MKTPKTIEEITQGAMCCFVNHSCADCPYKAVPECTDQVGIDLLESLRKIMEKLK